MGDQTVDGGGSGEAESTPVRRFGWSNMFLHPDDDPRVDHASANTERAVLVDFLSDQRLTLTLKCADLDAGSAGPAGVPPSDLSLLGLVRHLAGVEQVWFRIRMAGAAGPSALPQ